MGESISKIICEGGAKVIVVGRGHEASVERGKQL
jgi:hypothetical protein